MSATKYKRVDVDGFGVAYREAGPVNRPVLLLLHGFPTSCTASRPRATCFRI
jgi:pimeloyl-ACP methyl ester carboxylesterase